jgi:hypothetical protein
LLLTATQDHLAYVSLLRAYGYFCAIASQKIDVPLVVICSIGLGHHSEVR